MSIKNTDMRKFFNLFIAIGISGSLSAQFVNNGATIVVQSGATLRIETNLINNAGSTITNNGTIEVKGDFTNAATFNSPTGSTVKFIDTGNSTVTSGGAELRNVTIEKTTGANVILAGNMTVAGALNFAGANNRVVLGANNLTIKTGGTVTGVSANEYVNASAAGKLIKGVGGSSTVNMEVGDATNYTPISNVITGSGYTSASVSARVYTTGLQAKQTGATDFIAREWAVASTGITNYANTMTGTYIATDATGMQADIKGSTYHSGSWRFTGATAGALTATGSTTNNDVLFTGQNSFGRVNIKAFLQGPYSGGVMTTALNAAAPAPNMLETHALTSPYTDAPATVSAGFFLANPTIVDWVKIEGRNISSPSTPTSNKISAFIKSNGDIVAIDGTSLPTLKGEPTSVVVLSHRNHLPIRTPNAGISIAEGATQHNFSTGIAQAFTNGAITSNANMRNNGGIYAMWGGDVNSNGETLYNGGGNDRVPILSLVGGTANANIPLVDRYNREDVNMDSSIIYNGGGSDRVSILSNVGGTGNANIAILSHL